MKTTRDGFGMVEQMVIGQENEAYQRLTALADGLAAIYRTDFCPEIRAVIQCIRGDALEILSGRGWERLEARAADQEAQAGEGRGQKLVDVRRTHVPSGEVETVIGKVEDGRLVGVTAGVASVDQSRPGGVDLVSPEWGEDWKFEVAARIFGEADGVARTPAAAEEEALLRERQAEHDALIVQGLDGAASAVMAQSLDSHEEWIQIGLDRPWRSKEETAAAIAAYCEKWGISIPR